MFDFARTLAGIVTDTETVGERFAASLRPNLVEEGYFRFTVQQGLQDVGPTAHKERARIMAATEDYLSNGDLEARLSASTGSSSRAP